MLLQTIVLSIYLMAASVLYSQNDNSNSESSSYSQTFGKPLFLFNTYSFDSTEPNKSRLNAYLAFVNDILQFVKINDNSYCAKYEILIDVFDTEGNRLDGKTITKEITAENFAETNSRKDVNKHHFVFDLNPGSYEIYLELTDLDTKRHLARKQDVDLKNYADYSVAISDLMFVNSVEMGLFDDPIMFPNIMKALEEPLSDLSAFYELYASGQDSITLNLGIYTEDNTIVYQDSSVFLPKKEVIKQLVPLSKLVKTTGYYFIIVEAKTAKERVIKKEGFIIKYSNTPNAKQTFNDSTAILKAMKYIADSKDYSDIMKELPEERVKLTGQFWLQRDPTPETQTNELKDEFYRRVEFCLQYFSSNSDNRVGWETDRGKIYIIYGPPSEVQRRGGDREENPFEIWYYNHIDKRFVFMDKSGLGSYRLIHKD